MSGHTIEFRGDPEVEVKIDKVIRERAVNYYGVEWHFVAEEMADIELTEQEEEDVHAALWEIVDSPGYERFPDDCI